MTPVIVAYLLGLLTLPAVLFLISTVEKVHSGYWMDLDRRECDACMVPDGQWSPVHRCARCGRRQVRSWLYRLVGRRVLERAIWRGPRDEAWLNGEVDA